MECLHAEKAGTLVLADDLAMHVERSGPFSEEGKARLYNVLTQCLQVGIASLCVGLRVVSGLGIPMALRICKSKHTAHRERMILRGRLESTAD